MKDDTMNTRNKHKLRRKIAANDSKLLDESPDGLISRRHIPGEEMFWNAWPSGEHPTSRELKARAPASADRVLVFRSSTGQTWYLPAMKTKSGFGYMMPDHLVDTVGQFIEDHTIIHHD